MPRIPAVPRSVQAAGGLVRITTTVKPLKLEGVVCNGLYDPERRRIRIDASLPRAHQWKVLYHELVHVALLDAGLDNGMPDVMHEQIADAIATARIRERWG